MAAVTKGVCFGVCVGVERVDKINCELSRHS